MISADNSPTGSIVDDYSTLARNHSRQRILRHQERALQIHVNLLIPLALGALQCGLRIKYPRIVEQNVDAAKGAHRFIDNTLTLRRHTHVRLQKYSLAVGVLHAPQDRCTSLLVAPRNRHPCALAREQQRSSLAYSRSPASDQRHPIPESHASILSRRLYKSSSRASSSSARLQGSCIFVRTLGPSSALGVKGYRLAKPPAVSP